MIVRIAPVLRHLRSDGIRGFAYDVQALGELAADRRRLRGHSRTESTTSSISDDDAYPLFCQLATEDDAVFHRFRRSAIYMRILEHVTRTQGMGYLREIERDPHTLETLRALLTRHDVGHPRVYRFPGIGLASPTTLRYVKVVTDLRRLFGDLGGMRIAEIGIGYGGQARAITRTWNVAAYELFDLPPALALARRFLEETNAPLTVFDFHDGRQPDHVSVDLVVSNYALSEVRREVQDEYLEKVVLSAPRGYLTYNHISPPELRSYTAEEIVARIPGGAVLLPEVPLTDPRNVIIAWGMATASS